MEPEPEGKAETDRAPARRIPGTTAKAKPATPAKAATPSSSTEEEEEPAIPGLPALPEPAGPDRRERRPISPERPPSTVSTGAREDHLPSLLGTRFPPERVNPAWISTNSGTLRAWHGKCIAKAMSVGHARKRMRNA